MDYELVFYNKCSTAVKGLALLEENGIHPKIIDYFKNHLTEDELKAIAKKVGSVKAMLRVKNAKELGIDPEASDEELIKAMAQEPKIIQRPILIKGDKAIVGRPIEDMLALK